MNSTAIANDSQTFDGRPVSTVPGLLPHHLAELRRSGLSDATIKAAGIRSETKPERIAALLDCRKFPAKCAPAIVFQFRDAEGRNGYARCKPDHPRQSGGKPVKYESPRGRPNEIYLPPGVAELLPQQGGELLLTEGEKKSLAATQEGFPCIGLVGVYGWKESKSENLLPALERVNWQGRQVRIVFDSDTVTNPNVLDAESRLAAHLKRRGAIVRTVRLPSGPPDDNGHPTKMGLDDFLVAHRPVAFRKLLDEAGEPEPVAAVELKEAASKLDPATEAAATLKVDELGGLPVLRFWRGTFWRWRSGRYNELDADEVRGAVVRSLNQNYHHLTQSVTGNVFDQLRAQAMLSGRTEPPAWLDTSPAPWPAEEILAAKNGLVHLPSLVSGGTDYFHAATPKFFTTSALDYEFSAEAPEPTNWLAFLLQLWPDDPESIATLQEWFGYVLTPDTRQQKILLLIGPRRSGKGTVARVLRALVGPENCAGPTLAGLATNFGLWPLLGKSVAIVNDARLSGRSDQAVVVERLLSVSGEDAQTVDRKNLPPVTAKIPARLMVVSNELPRLADSAGALAGRMIVMALTRSFYGREDTTITDRLLGELPGILLWAIAGWVRLRARGHFAQPDSGRELAGELADLGSPVAVFLREKCVTGPACTATAAGLFDAWREWCEANGRREPGTTQTFGRDLRAAVPGLADKQSRDGDRRFRSYQGIGLALDSGR